MRPGGAGDPRSQGEERILGGPWLRSLIVWRRSRRTVGNRTLGGCRIRRAPKEDQDWVVNRQEAIVIRVCSFQAADSSPALEEILEESNAVTNVSLPVLVHIAADQK